MKINVFYNTLLTLCLTLSTTLKSEEKALASCCETSDNDISILQGFSFFNFFLYVPSSSIEESKKMNRLVMHDLEKFGKVVPKSLNVQKVAEEITDSNSSLKSPSLCYKIEKITDLQGNSSSLAVAMLELKGGATIEKTKTYVSLCFWSQQCYVQLKSNNELQDAVKKTLSVLLGEFSKDFQKANNDSQKKITFYFAE